jgi:hypothetical protein
MNVSIFSNCFTLIRNVLKMGINLNSVSTNQSDQKNAKKYFDYSIICVILNKWIKEKISEI